MEEGIVLVRKLSNIGVWNCFAWCSCCNCTTPSYSDQLVKLNKSLRILLKRLKLQQADDVKEVLRLNREIRDKQDDLERKVSDILKVQQEAGDVGGSSGSNTGTTIQQGKGGHQVAPLGGVGGAAALGAVLGVLFDTVARVKDKTMMLKRPLEDVKSTLDLLKPLIEEIAAYNKGLNLPKEELEKVRFQMEEGVELLHKCSKVRPWTSYKRHELANKLLGLDESLQGLLNILRVHLARDVRDIMVSVLYQIEESIMVQLQNDPTEIEDSCDVLEPPQPEVGLSVQGTRDVKETLDSAAKIEVGVKRIKGSGDVQGQTDMGIGEPTLPTLEAPDAENKVHFRRIIAPHMDVNLGDCSFLDTCRHMKTCKYVHYELDPTPDVSYIMMGAPALNSHKPLKPQHAEYCSEVELGQPQWINCDICNFRMDILGQFGVIMADPPWDIHMELSYGTMADDEMRNLNVPALQTDGLIFLWVTGRAMELGRECLELWGYKRIEELIWFKTNQLQQIIRTGRTGHWLNHSKEHCLVGIKGEPLVNRNIDTDVSVAEVIETSRKPDEM